jgi:hypothetical protein
MLNDCSKQHESTEKVAATGPKKTKLFKSQSGKKVE